MDAKAVEKIFALKGRSPSNPLIVHVLDKEMSEPLALLSSLAEKIFDCFWPGPITVVLPNRDKVPAIVRAGLPSVALRSPAHPKFRKVLKALNAPIAAPSANKSNLVSPTQASHVFNDFGSECPPILDGGECDHGIESTVVDLTSDDPKILRPGPIIREQIEDCLGVGVLGVSKKIAVASRPQKSPGTSKRHYSPKTPFLLKDSLDEVWGEDLDSRFDLIICANAREEKTFRKHGYAALSFSSEGDPVSIAKNLYSTFRIADQIGMKRLVSYKFQETSGIAESINDRLTRAASL